MKHQKQNQNQIKKDPGLPPGGIKDQEMLTTVAIYTMRSGDFFVAAAAQEDFIRSAWCGHHVSNEEATLRGLLVFLSQGLEGQMNLILRSKNVYLNFVQLQKNPTVFLNHTEVENKNLWETIYKFCATNLAWIRPYYADPNFEDDTGMYYPIALSSKFFCENILKEQIKQMGTYQKEKFNVTNRISDASI